MIMCEKNPQHGWKDPAEKNIKITMAYCVKPCENHLRHLLKFNWMFMMLYDDWHARWLENIDLLNLMDRVRINTQNYYFRKELMEA